MAAQGSSNGPIHICCIGKRDFGKGGTGARILDAEAARTTIYLFAIHIILPVGRDLVLHYFPQYSRRPVP